MLADSLISAIFEAMLDVVLVLLLGSIPPAILIAALWPKVRSVRRGFDEFRQRHKRRVAKIKHWLDGAVTPANTDKLSQLQPARLAIEEKIFSIELNRRTAPIQIGTGALGILILGSYFVTYLAWNLIWARETRDYWFMWPALFVPASQFFIGLYFGFATPTQLADADTTLRLINVQLLDLGLKLPSENELDAESVVAAVDNVAAGATKTA
jgi:hypothetical protein